MYILKLFLFNVKLGSWEGLRSIEEAAMEKRLNVQKDNISSINSKGLNEIVRNIVCPNIPNNKIYLITPTPVIICIRES